LKIVWIAMCAFAAVALFASLWTEEISLDRAHVTEQGFQYRERTSDEEKRASHA